MSVSFWKAAPGLGLPAAVKFETARRHVTVAFGATGWYPLFDRLVFNSRVLSVLVGRPSRRPERTDTRGGDS